MLKKFFKKLKPVYYIIAAVIAAVWLSAAAVSAQNRAEKYADAIQNQYSRAFNELTVFVDNIKNNLAKGVMVGDCVEMARIANKIYSQSAFASAALCQLPISDVSLANTSKFLSQVGDYTHSLAVKYTGGTKITDEEYNKLSEFCRYAEQLSNTLYEMQGKLQSGELAFAMPAGIADTSSENAALSGNFEEMEQQFADYPSLIYDGPFSDHIASAEPQYVKGAREIGADEAKARALEIAGKENINEIVTLDRRDGNLPAYCFEIKKNDNTSVFADISKQGGMLLWLLNKRGVTETKLSIDEAKKRAYDYLKMLDITSVRDTYYEMKDGAAVINFAYSENGVLMYPDLIKVKVALDNGEISGAELTGYIMNHRQRNLPAFSHTDAEVMQKISPKAEIRSVSKCLIPTDSGGEIFCYEVHCGYAEKEFLIYLNADTLVQENILMLLINENGSLTI